MTDSERRRKEFFYQVLLLIEPGDRHEIRNSGREPLRTVNIYVPPPYTDEGEELPASRT